MIICLPQKDEHIAGHIGRLAKLNGVDINSFIKTITAPGRDTSDNRFEPLDIYQRICALIGIPQEEYLKNHTMLPIRRFSAFDFDSATSFSSPPLVRQINTIIRLHDPAFFCPKCAEDDYQKMGFSTWKRIHKVIGINRCLTHGDLLYKATAHSPYSIQPHAFMAINEYQLVTDEYYYQHASVWRYGIFSKMMLDTPHRFSRKQIRGGMRHPLTEKNISIVASKTRLLLSEHILNQYPFSWLEKYFPTIAAIKRGSFSVIIDGTAAGMQKLAGENYAITLSYLFDDHTHSIKSIISPEPIKPRMTTKTLMNNDDVINLWLEHGGHIKKTSLSTGLSEIMIFRIYRKFGFPKRQGSQADDISKLRAFLKNARKEVISDWLSENIRIYQAAERSYALLSVHQLAPIPKDYEQKATPHRNEHSNREIAVV